MRYYTATCRIRQRSPRKVTLKTPNDSPHFGGDRSVETRYSRTDKSDKNHPIYPISSVTPLQRFQWLALADDVDKRRS
jgi:hypothetical protein